MHNKKIIFVLNDIDEVTFFAEDEANAEIAEKIAAIIEAKFKHNILPTNNEHYKYNRIFIFDEKRENTKIININQNNGDI